MYCRINLQSDPISLVIISAEGKEHQCLDTIGDGGFIEVEIAAQEAETASPPIAVEAGG